MVHRVRTRKTVVIIVLQNFGGALKQHIRLFLVNFLLTKMVKKNGHVDTEPVSRGHRVRDQVFLAAGADGFACLMESQFVPRLLNAI